MRWQVRGSNWVLNEDTQLIQRQTWSKSYKKEPCDTWEGCKWNIWANACYDRSGSERIFKLIAAIMAGIIETN